MIMIVIMLKRKRLKDKDISSIPFANSGRSNTFLPSDYFFIIILLYFFAFSSLVNVPNTVHLVITINSVNSITLGIIHNVVTGNEIKIQ